MFESSLISADQNWALWAVLVSVAAAGIILEKTKFGSKLSAVVISISGTFILSNLSIIPNDAPTYDIVWSYLVPIAIPLLLFKANIKKIIAESGATLIAFVIGGIGTVMGTIVAYYMVFLGEEGWKLAGIFCATYVGGSMNYVAAAEALQLKSGALLTAGIAADNLVMTLYFLLLFAIPTFGWLTKYFNSKEEIENGSLNSDLKENSINLENLSKSLAISILVCSVGFGLQNLLQIKGSAILIITIIIVSAATIFPDKFSRIEGADKLGTYLMQIFFAAIGASANISVVLEVGPILFVFAALILLIHLAFLLTAGKILKLDIRELVIASNANMGGPTTAAAMAVARKWNGLVIPAILCGTLGYAIATFIGVGIGNLLN